MCVEHGVLEAVCTKCNPALVAALERASGVRAATDRLDYAVDLSPAQLNLVELKKTAVRHLDYEAALAAMDLAMRYAAVPPADRSCLFMPRRGPARRPDAPAVAQATVRAAMSEAARLMPGLPLVAGGRSFGGRMTSQAQAQSPLPAVRGLVFLAFPLHPAGKPSAERSLRSRSPSWRPSTAPT